MKFNQERAFRGTNRPIRKGEVVNEVFKTNDYSIFVLSKFNRNVIFRKEMLEQAKEGIISPIVVNEEMIVIDGQNRLLHSEKAGVPVEYIIKEGLTEDDIVRMNTVQKPWSLQNYIEAFANQGLEEYEKLIDLINQRLSNVTNIVQISLNAPTDTRKPIRSVKSGKFKFFNYEKTVEFLQYSKRFRSDTKTPKIGNVETALYELYRLSGIDRNRIIDKVVQTGVSDELKVKRPTHTEALKMLLDAYNNRLNEDSERFLDHYITSHGTIVINTKRQKWAKEKTANDSDQ